MRYLPFLIFFLVSCSTVQLSQFNPGSTNEEQFQRDGASCQMEAQKYEAQAGMGFWNAHGNYNDMLETCMRSKGYLRK